MRRGGGGGGEAGGTPPKEIDNVNNSGKFGRYSGKTRVDIDFFFFFAC